MPSRLGVLWASCMLLVAVVVVGCGGSSGAGNGASTGAENGQLEPVSGPLSEDGTFSVAIPLEPGSLDFATNIGTSTQLIPFAYDALVATVEGKKLEPNLATRWTQKKDSLTFEIRPGVTCSDNSPVTPAVIARSFAFYKTPEAQYKLFGDVSNWDVHGDNAAGTVTFSFGEPVGFPVQLLADVPVVCGKGLEDRKMLKDETSGSGPYVLTEAVPGDHYVLTRREGYKWGPDGATTAEPGLPKKVEVRVVESPSTTSNLMLGGELSAAGLPQSEEERIGDRLRVVRVPKDQGQMIYNSASDHVTGDPVVRRALTMVLEREGIATVAKGSLSNSLFAPYTNPCASSSTGKAIPAYDPDAAAKLLDEAGWREGSDGIREKDGEKARLEIFTGNEFPQAWTAATELAAKAWRELGFEVKSRVLSGNAQLQAVLSGEFDVAPMEAISGTVPPQITSLITGPPPPQGSNIPRIENAAYEAHAKKALAEPDTKAACVEWNAGEEALYEEANLIPVVIGDRLFVAGDNIEFAVTTYGFVPTSVRLHEG